MMRVLVVEDEKRLAAGLRAGLVAEGFAVDVALTGTDGLTMACSEPYDAIVMDIMLPGMNGFRLMHELRHQVELRAGLGADPGEEDPSDERNPHHPQDHDEQCG